MSLQSEATLAELRRASMDGPQRRRHEALPEDRIDEDERDEADYPATLHPVPVVAAAVTILTAAAIGIGIWYSLGQ